MTSVPAKLLEEASQLPTVEKLLLVDQLIASLDLPDPGVESLWALEAERRSNAIRNGDMTSKPLDEALHKHA